MRWIKVVYAACVLASCAVVDSTEEIEQDVVQICPAAYLLTTPVAGTCCYDATKTLFFRPTDGYLISRARNPNGTGCKATDGVSACSGNACFYGPNGFARAVLTAPTGPYRYMTYTGADPMAGASRCSGGWWQEQTNYYGYSFDDVTGTFPTGQGCPGGNGSTSSTAWDY